MLGLKLREEFTGKRAGGTIIDFNNRRGTGALDRSAKDFLAITYPSIDLLKTIEAVQPDSTRPVVIIGSRGQGKSHLMAALAHMLQDVDAGSSWGGVSPNPRKFRQPPKIANLDSQIVDG